MPDPLGVEMNNIHMEWIIEACRQSAGEMAIDFFRFIDSHIIKLYSLMMLKIKSEKFVCREA